MRRLIALVCCFACTFCPADAAETGTLEEFLERYHCEVTARLQILYGRNEPLNRYITIGVRGNSDKFVQCLFEDDNSGVLCEAASGFYSAKAGEPRRFSLDQAGRAKVKAFGFYDDDSTGNFSQIIGVNSAAKLPVLAHMMLSVLYDVYGAHAKSELWIRAPLAPLTKNAKLACSPIS